MTLEKSPTPFPPPDDRSEPSIEHKLKRLSELFSLLGSDPEQNIHIIVQQAARVLESACALYTRIDDQQRSLSAWSGYNPPPGFPPDDKGNSQICNQTAAFFAFKGGSQPLAIGDLAQTPHFWEDPYIRQYGIKSYIGCPVHCKGKTIGTLCIVDIRTRNFTQVDTYIIGTLGKSLSLEEERHEAEAALRRSEAEHRRLYKLLRLMADNVPDMIWAKDLDDRYMFVNQAMCDKLLKCKRPEDAIDKTEAYFARKERELGHRHTFGELGIESDRITKRRKLAGRFVEEGLIRNEHLVLDIHKAPFWGENGQLIGTVGCGRDITREKLTAQALQESEKRYRDLYNNTPVMLYSLDREGRVTSVSNLWLEIMGYKREEVIGRHAFDFLAPESRREARESLFPHFYKSGQMRSQPCQFVTKSGGRREVLLSAIAQRDAEGEYDGALAFVIDVTQTKEAEKDQRRLTTRLQQAQKMEAIATLAGGIAHQFNNALAVILGNIELIYMDGIPDGKLQRFIGPINQAGQKMVHLTSQLLAYARGGKFQTQIVPSHRFVHEAMSLVSHSLASYVELKTDLDETADPIEVDSTQMQMLLAAILSNASEAIEQKGTVTVTLRNADLTSEDCLRYPGIKPGKFVLLRIQDTGKGMDEQACTRIFEPFFTTKFQGRGLGMAAVYGIVKKHGGYVYVESEPGQGTTVSVYLPRARWAQPVPEQQPRLRSRRSGTALIIEDEQLVMEVNRAIVEKLGYQVLEAKTGKEALHIARTYEGHIDFALLDVILPDTSGNQIYPKLKEILPQLKVIVCSGFTLDGPAREILNAGAESFLPKPFTVAALSSALDEILKDN
ncbi:MAG: PAS domain S-box protein [Desulfobacteraceae bacterium]|nr:MAG: PAS domain S-box protein [Desulfobacteraceae bacterium]